MLSWSTFLFFHHPQFVPFHFIFCLLFLPILSSHFFLLMFPLLSIIIVPSTITVTACSFHFPLPPPLCSLILLSLLVECSLACINRRIYPLDTLSVGTSHNWPLTLKLIVLPGVTPWGGIEGGLPLSLSGFWVISLLVSFVVAVSDHHHEWIFLAVCQPLETRITYKQFGWERIHCSCSLDILQTSVFKFLWFMTDAQLLSVHVCLYLTFSLAMWSIAQSDNSQCLIPKEGEKLTLLLYTTWGCYHPVLHLNKQIWAYIFKHFIHGPAIY